MGGYLALPNSTPFEMLRVYRYLRDAIPDVSDAVWTWKRLCQTGFEVEVYDASSEMAAARGFRRSGMKRAKRSPWASGGRETG